MAIGVSILLVAAGAILTWGVDRAVSGIDVSTIGVILMVVGAIGFFASLTASSAGAPWRRQAVIESDPAREDPYAVERLRK